MLGVLVCVLATFAQQSTPRIQDRTEKNSDDQGSTIRVDTDLILLDVSVKGSDGRSIMGLRKEDFEVFEDGVKQQVALFSTSDVPLNIVLILDTSGSTEKDVSLMRRAAKRFLEEIRPKDRIALVSFSQSVQLLSNFTADRNRLDYALGEMEPGSGTALYDTLVVTLNDLLRRVDGRKALVVLTDGVDSFGNSSFRQVVPLVDKSRATLYFLELDSEAETLSRLLLDCENDRHFKLSRKQMRKYGEHYEKNTDWWRNTDYCALTSDQRRLLTGKLYELAHDELKELADRSGGRVYPVKGNNELSGIFSQIATELRTLYSIGYYSTNDKRDGKWRALQVAITGKNITAMTKPGYRAPMD